MTPSPGQDWDELHLSEDPAVEVLQALGYTYVAPEVLEAERESPKQTILTGRLGRALGRLNPWLSDDNTNKAIRTITTVQAASLLDASEKVHTDLTSPSRMVSGQAREYLPRRAAQWASRLGPSEPRIVVAEPPKRWGSTAKNGTVRINWRVLQCPVALVDYVLVHELVHLIHEDHSRAFWATLGAIMPDYEERKKRLRAMGPRLMW